MAYSPAALALMARGVTCASIAEALDTNPPAVSRWLHGERTPPDAFWGAIARLGGEDLAEDVRRLVADAQAAQDLARDVRRLAIAAQGGQVAADVRRLVEDAKAAERQSAAS